MSLKDEFIVGLKRGLRSMKWLIVFNIWAFFSFGMLALALIAVDPASAIGLLAVSGYSFSVTCILYFISKKIS